MDKDVYFLKKTFKLAKKGEGTVSPNPLVGAIFVKKGKVIAEGYHQRCGAPHAEIEAINKASFSLAGSALYVNLEPCCHFGRTPPCVDEIIKRKVKRVVIATADPNPRVGGKSIVKLRQAGISVRIGLCREEARRLNEVFFKNMREKAPFVVIKTAQSLDGKIAARTGLAKWITSSASRRRAKSLRDKYDCVLVGINTVIADDPCLCGLRKTPYKVIIDPYLKMPLSAKMLREDPDKVIIFSLQKSGKIKKKFPRGVRVFFMPAYAGRIKVRDVLKKLYNLDIMSVFVEGGAQTIGAFFDEKVVDKVYFFIAPKIIGGRQAIASVGGRGVSSPERSFFLKDAAVERVGEEILVSGYPKINAKCKMAKNYLTDYL